MDKSIYPNYNEFVPLEMNIARLINRIVENYYRTVDGLCGDVLLIGKNAEKFNTPDTYISIKAKKIFGALAEHLKNYNDNDESLESFFDTLEGFEGVRAKVPRGGAIKIEPIMHEELKTSEDCPPDSENDISKEAINLVPDVVNLEDESKKSSRKRPRKRKAIINMDSEEDEDDIVF